MFQFAFEASLLRLTYEAPQFAPLFELPPRIGTRVAPNKPDTREKYLPLLLRKIHPLLEEWFTRQGGTDGPVRVRSAGAEVDGRSAASRTGVRGATAKRHARAGICKPKSVTEIL